MNIEKENLTTLSLIEEFIDELETMSEYGSQNIHIPYVTAKMKDIREELLRKTLETN